MKLTSENFGTTPDGTEVAQYTIKNSTGATVRLIDWGASVTELCVPDREGNIDNVNLGFDDLESYIQNPPFLGAIIGRFGNRIGEGTFSIDGESYHLAKNDGPHHLHGGTKGFSHQLWQGTPFEEDEKAGVTFELTSPDGDEGYPGELKVKVIYTFTEDCELRIDYEATITEKPTVVNLTNHCYWNLNGAGKGNVHDHQLQLSADKYLEVDEHTLPTGNLLDVAETAFDFTIPKTLGEHISDAGDGYDHCFVLNESDVEIPFAARISSPATGRVMEVLTTEPGIQLYTGNYLDGSPGTAGFGKHEAFCLECQHFPDSPNKPNFPSTLLAPGETYRQTTVHRFDVER